MQYSGLDVTYNHVKVSNALLQVVKINKIQILLKNTHFLETAKHKHNNPFACTALLLCYFIKVKAYPVSQ